MGRLPMHHPVAVWRWVLHRAVGLARADFACLSTASLILIGTGVCRTDSAHAQSAYPTRSISFVVPFPAGGTSDILARRFGQKITEFSGQTVVIENVTGASTILGAERVAKAPANGYTFLVATSTTVSTNPNLFRTLPYSIDDFEPVALLGQHPLALLVNAALPIATVNDLLARARTVPGGLTYASTGRGGLSEVFGEMLKAAWKVPMRDIPYRGSAPAVTAILQGEIDLHFDGITSSLSLYRGGKLHILAITGATRSSSVPELPTLVELGYKDLVIGNIYCLLAPRGTPRPAIETMNTLIARAQKALAQWLIDEGITPDALSPQGLQQLIARDNAQMARIVRELRIPLVD